MIELELVCIAGDLDAIAVGIEKTYRAIAGDNQSFRAAYHRNFAPPENRMDFVDDVVRVDINTEMVQLRYAFTTDRLFSFRHLHQSDIVMLPSVAQKGQADLGIARRDFQSENIPVKALR